MEIVILALSLLLLAVASFLSIARLRGKAEQGGDLSRLFSLLAWVGLTLFLVLRGISIGTFPATNLCESLALFGWCTLAIHWICNIAFAIPSLSAFLLPLGTVLAVFSILHVNEAPHETVPLQGAWLAVHAGLSFLAWGAFAVSFACAAMYLLQEKQLRLKHFWNFFPQMPSLEKLDRVIYRTLLSGFPLLTLAIFSGAVWAHVRDPKGISWLVGDPMVFGAIMVWFMYAMIFGMRWIYGLSGRYLAYLSILGFTVLVLTLISTGLFSGALHKAL